MEEWRWKSCIQALKDYHDTDEYIEKVTKEIRHPYRETDVNGDIKGTRTDNDTMFDTLWTIESHKAIHRLKRNKQAIDKLLDECGRDTEIIIRELHMRKFPQYTINGLVSNNRLTCGRNKAIDLRRKFMVELDKLINN